ncbi:MAG: division/cell wall cluster transcriptional repressor MraZ [Anaerolineae bacterium]
MLVGKYPHTLDAKGRLTIPVQFRSELTDGLYITIGFKNCLLIYPRNDFEELVRKLKALPSTNKAVSSYMQLVLGSAFLCELDAMGRVLIPAVLRDEIHLEQDALVVGQVSVIEIWRPEELAKITEDVRARGDSILDELADLGV